VAVDLQLPVAGVEKDVVVPRQRLRSEARVLLALLDVVDAAVERGEDRDADRLLAEAADDDVLTRVPVIGARAAPRVADPGARGKVDVFVR